MKVGVVKVAGELLRSVLHFPAGTEIVGVRDDPYRVGDIELRVTHADIPDTEVGKCIPYLNPTFRREFAEEKVIFCGWNAR